MAVTSLFGYEVEGVELHLKGLDPIEVDLVGHPDTARISIPLEDVAVAANKQEAEVSRGRKIAEAKRRLADAEGEWRRRISFAANHSSFNLCHTCFQNVRLACIKVDAAKAALEELQNG